MFSKFNCSPVGAVYLETARTMSWYTSRGLSLRSATAVSFQDGRHNIKKEFHQPGIELLAGPGSQFLDAVLQVLGILVGPGGCHGVEGIGQGNNPGAQGNIVTLQTIIPFTVPALVVIGHQGLDNIELLQGSKDLDAEVRVPAHYLPLSRGQPGSLMQDGRSHPDFTNIMKQAAQGDNVYLILLHTQPFSQGRGQVADVARVLVGRHAMVTQAFQQSRRFWCHRHRDHSSSRLFTFYLKNRPVSSLFAKSAPKFGIFP
ncbi:alanyl-tRNA synthetase [Moorella thermoacetica Y72]|uniref:Alanyl-tRNA synthetase n=1 Tax=Moorella thermoacetica Y72 TaxID=1325331 RepID=A0A0S6UFI1_NEOTH|nr:alanyl-tRNA synthetase [Moorella thermoacetica Y72]